MNNEVLFSSKSTEWETPDDFYKAIDSVCRFDLDVCATADNAKCGAYIPPESDALSRSWEGSCWMNPPYGKQVSKWVEKAFNEGRRRGTKVVCLLPSRTDTRWWHDFAAKGRRIYIKGRLKFGGMKNSAPFPSVLVVFGGGRFLVSGIRRALSAAGYQSVT